MVGWCVGGVVGWWGRGGVWGVGCGGVWWGMFGMFCVISYVW